MNRKKEYKMDKLRKIEINTFVLVSLQEELQKIKYQLDVLDGEKNNKVTEISNLRTTIESFETELYTIEENINILKSNKSEISNKIEEIKKIKNL
jgi:capsule polysaccharide export protein KpsE/RkpR